MKRYIQDHGKICGIINPNGVTEPEKNELYSLYPDDWIFYEEKRFDAFMLRYVTVAIFTTEEA